MSVLKLTVYIEKPYDWARPLGSRRYSSVGRAPLLQLGRCPLRRKRGPLFPKINANSKGIHKNLGSLLIRSEAETGNRVTSELTRGAIMNKSGNVVSHRIATSRRVSDFNRLKRLQKDQSICNQHFYFSWT